MKRYLSVVALLLTFLLTIDAQDEIKVQRTLSDNAILQQNVLIPIEGKVKPGASVSMRIGKSLTSLEVDKSGHWKTVIPPMPAGGPHEISFYVDEKEQSYKNIYFGDVWLCSGQSNMEWTLNNTYDAEREIANANDSLIRHFKVPHANADMPQDELPGGTWITASPATVGDFSAVAYYFAKELRKYQNIPIGLLNSSWGGSRIEPWISKETLDEKHPDYSLEAYAAKHNINRKAQAEKLMAMFPGLTDKDIGMVNGEPLWAGEIKDQDQWKAIDISELWENQGYKGADGIAYYRLEFDLNEKQRSDKITLNLGAIDDADQTWFNGTLVGATNGYNTERNYEVKKSILKASGNIILIQVSDTGGGGGLYSADFKQTISTDGGEIDLKDLDWKFRLAKLQINQLSNKIPNLIYNAMIHPIINFPIKGVIWYQGESNAGDLQTAYDYRFHMETLIEEWRSKWNNPDLPFLYVSLANFMAPMKEPGNDGWAVIRESMSEVLKLPNTGQAIIIDIGNANDIHPRNKKDVGYRLSLPALKIVHDSTLISGSPMYKSHDVNANKIIVDFTETGSGLMVKNRYGYVNGFSIAGSDQKFHWAEARIVNGKVEVSSDRVPNPVAVRYAWETNPFDVNLFSTDGLPVTPFRTDDWDVKK